LAFYSARVLDDREELRSVAITSVPRTLLDLAAYLGARALARSVREAIRLGLTTIGEIADYLGRNRGLRGAARLGATIARYTGLPIERARSGAEVRAMEALRDARLRLPDLNARIAGEEADLSWRPERLIIEIDGAPFHLDRGEDARKQARWEAAGWIVRRLPSDDVHERPERLIALAPQPNVRDTPP
jgi:very-short-patch-repair endonuclease